MTPHSGCRPAAFTTLAHFSVSLAIISASLGGRHPDRHAADVGEALEQRRVLQARVDLAVEPLDDLGRRASPARRRRSRRWPRTRGSPRPWSARPAAQASRAGDMMASARTAPLLMCGSEFGSASTPAWIRPEIMSVIIGAPPVYGMWTNSMPVEVFSSSIDRWLMVRAPNEAIVDLARIGFGIGDELGDVLGRHARVDRPAPAAVRPGPRPATMSRWKSNGSDL